MEDQSFLYKWMDCELKEEVTKGNVCYFPSTSFLIQFSLTIVKECSNVYSLQPWFNPLNTKCRQLYLKTQFVLRSKHFSSRL